MGYPLLKKNVATGKWELPDADNSNTVNGHKVESDVPVDAKFTDTIYDDSYLKQEVNNIKTAYEIKQKEYDDKENIRENNEDERIKKYNQAILDEKIRIDNEGDETKGRVKAENDRNDKFNQIILFEEQCQANEKDRKQIRDRILAEEKEINNNELNRIYEDNIRTANGKKLLELQNQVTQDEIYRKQSDISRNEKIQALKETELLLKSDNNSVSMSVVKDSKNRISLKKYEKNNIIVETIERNNFDDNNNPLQIIRKTYDDNGKGNKKMIHHLKYDELNDIVEDNVEQSAYDIEKINISRIGVAINPLCSTNYVGGNVYKENEIIKNGVSEHTLCNNISTFEIVGDRIFNTFRTDKNEKVVV